MHRRTLLVTAAVALAARPALAAPPPSRMPPPVMTGRPGPLPMVADWTLPAVEATVNGRGHFWFGLDTGAPGGLHIRQGAASALGLRAVGQTLIGDPSGKNARQTPVYAPLSIGVGGATFTDVEADGMPDVAGPGPAIDGLLGMDIFDALTLTLDFKRRQVSFSTVGLPPGDGVSVLEYGPGPFIVVPLSIGALTVQAVIDTGQTRVPLAAPKAAIPRLPTVGAPRAIGVAHTVSQTLTLYAVSLAGPVRLGGAMLPVTEIAYPMVGPATNVGAKALQSLALSIDRVSRRVRLS